MLYDIDWPTFEAHRLSRLQKRASRIILNAPYDTASSDMLNALGWPTIEKRHSYTEQK